MLATLALVLARSARSHARSLAVTTTTSERPFAPPAKAAPFISLGYRELAADLLFVRMAGYFASRDSEASVIADLAEAITTLDPKLRRAYNFGAVAIVAARHGIDNAARLRSIALLEKATAQFPTDWRFPKLAGQFYIVELDTSDPKERKQWDERGARLLEAASRKPGAPAETGMLAIELQSRLGQTQAAIDSLQELLAITDDVSARRSILEKLEALTKANADEIGAELLDARRRFERRWREGRGAVPATMYVLVGAPLAPGFDLVDLATGGRDLIGSEVFERLEPVTDDPPETQRQ